MQKRRVFIDTNAIVEAHRTGCWKTIINRHDIETVNQCVVECGTGNQRRPGYVHVDLNKLKVSIKVWKVEDDQVAALRLRLKKSVFLDAGEEQLLAFAIHQTGMWWICSPDNDSIRAALKLGIHEKLISLKKLADEAGIKPNLEDQYRKKWLRKKIGQYFFEEI